jgi:hypothetical protein
MGKDYKMAHSKKTSEAGTSLKQLNGRRSFIWKAGAAMSAVVASAVSGISKPAGRADGSKDANAVRMLHRTYESLIDKGRYEEALDLFADKAEAVFNGGIFAGKRGGLRRLYFENFSAGMTGKKIEPPASFEPDPARDLDIVEVAPDGKTASGRFPYSMQVGTPIEGNSSLLEMARLHGEGIAKRWEGGICEASYLKVGESWKIRRIEYRALSKAHYRPGQHDAKPVDVPAFAVRYPDDPKGPDRLV